MATAKSQTYFEGVGRRKEAIARVRIRENPKRMIEVNKRAYDSYFPTQELQSIVLAPFSGEKLQTAFAITAHIKGGGITGQAEAFRHGLARALIKYDDSLRGRLKTQGFLRRDARVKERKKFGLRKARRAPQWSKR